MQTYIVLDLEWNQSTAGKAGSVSGLPFEIIEIGAVKLDENLNKIDEYTQIIRPVIYKKMHFHVSEVVHIGIDELRNEGELFVDVIDDFLDWCDLPSKPIFCTWGEMDLMQLQRNMLYHNIDPTEVFPYPFLYYDVQKLYAKLYPDTDVNSEPRPKMPPLDKATEEMGIVMEEDFHRALSDAKYTAEVMSHMHMEKVSRYLSLDYFRIPENKEEELYLLFPDYTKYVSRAFDTKEKLFSDSTVTDVICPRCNVRLKKRIPWFSSNQKQYQSLGYCSEHGNVKAKIRTKHTDDNRIFAVKTIKLVSQQRANDLALQKNHVAEKRRERAKQRSSSKSSS